MLRWLNSRPRYVSFDAWTWWCVVINLLGIGAAIGLCLSRCAP